jgi:hypothetical protein
MHKLYDLKEMLTKELEAYGTRDKIDVTSLDIIDKLAHSIKNICKITEEGGSYDDGSYRRSYDGSYRRSYDMSRDGYSRKRDSMGRYSGAERDMDGLVAELRDMMPDLPEEKKREVQRFIQKVEQM